MSDHFSPRFFSAGIASILIGVSVLGAATSSAQRQPPAVTAVGIDVPAAAVAPAQARGVGGTFAPPAPRVAAAAAAPRALAPALPSGPLGIPGIVLQAYKLAADRVGGENPACGLPWYLLAGIGRIESGHAGDGSVDASGTTINPIEGPLLNGTLAGNEVITDTDRGAIDGDAGHDRAVGPMQFIPSTWRAWGADANGDGTADPNNIFDATYSAGRYLCAGVSDIMAPQRRVASVLRYNNSVEYATNVLSWASAYATGVMPTAGTIEAKRSPSTAVSAPVPAPVRPGAPPATRPPGGQPAPATGRFTRPDTPFTSVGTIDVASPAGPVSCALNLTGKTSADGTTAAITSATVGGNALCGLARATGLPWSLTPRSTTSIEVTQVAVDALGMRCGPVTVSGAPTATLVPGTRAVGPCSIRGVRLRAIPEVSPAQ